MARKSFTSHAPSETHEIEINGEVFPLNPQVPGDLLLDFISQADSYDPSKLAKAIRQLLSVAVVAEHSERFNAFIRDPHNGVDLPLLSEIAGYVTEVMSGGNDHQPLPAPSLSGL